MPMIWEPHLNDAATKWRTTARNLTAAYFEPLAHNIDQEQRYPVEHLEPLTQSGVAGMFIPKE